MAEPVYGLRYSDLQRERDDLATELTRVNKICNGLRSEMDRLKDEIEALTNENGVLRRRNVDLGKQEVRLKADLAAAVELLRENNADMGAVSTRLMLIGGHHKLCHLLEKSYQRAAALLARLD